MLNLDQLDRDLKAAEGFRGFVYDDATAQAIKPGSLVHGHPTVGYGLALDVDPLDDEEAAWLLARRRAKAVIAVAHRWPWSTSCSDARQRALVELAYNLGVTKLAGFTTFLGLCERGEWIAAADDLKATMWAEQVGPRALRIEDQIRRG